MFTIELGAPFLIFTRDGSGSLRCRDHLPNGGHCTTGNYCFFNLWPLRSVCCFWTMPR